MAHDHAHDHHHGGRRFVAAAIFQTAFVAFEILCGFIFFPNPAIVADAGHNCSDIAFSLLSAAVRRVTSGRGHWVEYHLERRVSMLMCLATIVIIGGVVGYEAFKPLNTSSIGLAVTGGLGIAGFGVNFSIGRYLKHSSDRLAQTTAQHYISDAKASLFFLPPVAAAAGLGVGLRWHWLARLAMIGGAIVITAITARDNLGLAGEIRQDLRDCNESGHQSTQVPSQRSS